MPELPEVETIVNDLKLFIENKVIRSVKVFEKRSVNGNQKEFIASLVNIKIRQLFRRGKYICFQLENGSHLTVHLRMTGKLLLTGSKNHQEDDSANLLSQLKEKDKKYVRVKFVLSDNYVLYFVDVRKFGNMKLWAKAEPLLPSLGPEPMSPRVILKILNHLRTTRFIKTVLLDQRVLAGVGNIYADEVLFRSGIHPQAHLSQIDLPTRKKLSQELPRILKKAIENRGTTISDYRTPDAGEGGNQVFLKVYGRRDLACYNCTESIKRIVVNGRSSHFCPCCQVLKPLNKNVE